MRVYILLFLALLSSTVFAATVTVPEETTPVKIGTAAEIDILVASHEPETISLTLLDNYPWITQSTQIMNLGRDDRQKLALFVNPFQGMQVGVYKLTLLVEPVVGNGTTEMKYIFVNVQPMDAVAVDKITIDGNFTPTGSVNIDATYTNYKSVIVQNAKIITSVNSPSSEIMEFEQPIDAIDPDETQEVAYVIKLPQYSEPGLYTVVMKIVDGDQVREKTRSFGVERVANFVKESSKSFAIFGFTKTISVTNIGNVADDILITDEFSPLDAAFYSGETPVSTSGGTFSWIVENVGPGQTKDFKYSISYAPIMLILGVLIVALFVFFYRVRTLHIKKYLLEKKFIEEGEEFTVGVEVSNMSGNDIDEVTVKDFVPSVFTIKEGSGPKPIAKKVATGMELSWTLRALHNKEERILSYKIIPMFGIHGKIRLPQAFANYKGRKARVEKGSWYATIGIEMENYADKGRKFFKMKKK